MPGALWLLLGVALVTTVWWMGRWSEVEVSPREDLAGAEASSSPSTPSSPPTTALAGGARDPVTAPDAVEPDMLDSIPGPPVDGAARVALVIDDLGRSVGAVRRLAGLGVPVTFAVLPFETRTDEVVAALDELGAEVLLHLPMQASGAQNPGPGALLLSMSSAEIVAATEAALDRVPSAVGVNNHMGSAFTESSAAVEPMMRELAERGLFFLDSRTSPRTAAFDMARRWNVPAARRTVFLDNNRVTAAIREQFFAVLDTARREGAAIAIGHPYPETLEVLEEEVERARRLGFEFVPVSFLLERTSADF